MNAVRVTFVAVLGVVVLLSGCTSTQTGTGVGAGIGSVVGGLAGQAIGRNTASTLIGAGAGALGGAIVGGAVGQGKDQAATEERLQRAESQAYRSQAQPQGSPQGGSITSASSYQGDPTGGQLVNGTNWVIHVYIDREPAGGTPPTATMNPGDVRPLNLDVGQHRIAAAAYVQTQFGQRQVGRYDQILNVDPRGGGFKVQFSTASFQ
ncbi:MAG: hypothetical protein HYY96_09100 [Candidatus Tectomicrobia bacterium]|nr:hypothetical protein [Candidatus Tectomicrobia bacterium]